MKNTSNKGLRVGVIVLMALTTAMNFLGGVGTTCAAFLTKSYPPYWGLIKPVDYRWLYQSLVVTTILIGIAGLTVTISLVRGKERVHRNSIIVLVIGTLLGGTQYFASLMIIGKAVPANIKFYINAFTLVVFLLLLLPGLREKVDFTEGGADNDKDMGAGLAAIVAGVIITTVPMWAEASHTYMGDNWVFVLGWQIAAGGTLLILAGLALLAKAAWKSYGQEVSQEASEIRQL